MKTYNRLNHAVAHQMVILIKGEGRGYGTRVGASWQPDVAQFLLQMVPNALDHGIELSDIAPLIGEDDDLWDEEVYDFDDDDDDWEDDE
ncbi:MAG: hypothetical protein QM434_03250 [Spirochaetota bacterium]|nr:hypothetical protein [Spirochaetota bacterium]HOQ93742.1 hypothetical protein [Sphaerochaeta sp.]HQB91145.1 hypothetical protein [Sphaerochaeta sp.]